MQCLDTFRLAPSVGLSEPWRIVRVISPELRQKSIENYQTANATALEGYDGEKAAMYSGLKLSGMSEAPEHIAIFCDDSTSKRLRPWRDDHARNAPLFCCGCDQSDVATCPLPWFRYGVGLHSGCPKTMYRSGHPSGLVPYRLLVYRLARSQLYDTRIRNRWLGNPPRGPAHRNPLRSQCSD